MNNQSTLEKIRELRLSGMYQAFCMALETRQHQQLTADELLAYLIEAEWNHRNNIRIKTAIKQAKFRYTALVENINFHQNRGLDKNTFLRLLDCSFIERKENLIMVGPTGTGKSYLISALGHQACMMGFKVRYFNVGKLFSSLRMAKADASYMREMNKLERQDLLILDDFGLHPIETASRLALLEIMEDRHGKRATVLSSQIPVSKWHELLGEETVADAILDRLVHTAHRIELKGESMRKKQAIKQEAESTH